jgi:AcrR family transcriptional regulator
VWESVSTTAAKDARAERQQQILDVAERVFGGRGYGVSSMHQIAARAGISRSLLSSYFHSKEELYVACVDRARGRLMRRAAEAGGSATSPEDQLRAFVRVLFDEFDRERDSWWIFYGSAPVSAIDDMRRKNVDLVAGLLEGGWPGCPRHAYEMVAASLVGAGEMAGRWWIEHPAVPKDDAVDRFQRFALASIDGLLA